MIIEAIWSLICGMVSGLVDILPHYTAPKELDNVFEQFTNQMMNFASLGVWVNWGVLNFCVMAAMGSWFTGLIFKIGKQALAHVPAVGGAG